MTAFTVQADSWDGKSLASGSKKCCYVTNDDIVVHNT